MFENMDEGWRAQQLKACVVLQRAPIGSQHPHGGSSPPATPLSGNPVPFSDLDGHQAAYGVHT